MNGAFRKGTIPTTGFRTEVLLPAKFKYPDEQVSRPRHQALLKEQGRVTACLSLKPYSHACSFDQTLQCRVQRPGAMKCSHYYISISGINNHEAVSATATTRCHLLTEFSEDRIQTPGRLLILTSRGQASRGHNSVLAIR